MKHIRTYSEINEKKSVGLIFHFTDPASLLSILKEDRMHSGHGYISFTRNPDLKAWHESFGAYCRIVFNGSDLSDRFHIEPYLFDPTKDPIFADGHEPDYTERKKLYGAEREERIRGNEIHGIMKYIVKIDILNNTNTNDEEQKSLKEITKNFGSVISINFVDKFTPVRDQIT